MINGSPLGNRATGIMGVLDRIARGEQTSVQPQMSPANPPSQYVPNMTRGADMLESADINNPFRMQSDPAGSTMPAMERRTAEMMSSPMQAPQQAQQEGVVRGGGIIKTPEDAQKAQLADAVTRKVITPDGGVQADPSTMDKIKGFFGDEENMLNLALAFNTMRMEPDQGLAAVVGKRLEGLRATKVSAIGAKSIASQLYKMGYKDYANQALQNPALAAKIYEQVIQKDLKPEASDKVSGVQYDRQGNAYVVITKQGQNPEIKMLGIQGDSLQDKTDAETAALRVRQGWDLSSKRSDEALTKAGSIRGQLDDYQRALVAVRNGAETGVIRNMLPAFDAQTAALRQSASRLGIGVINSATFGALSEKELDLALKTAIDTSLTGKALEDSIIASMQATEKLYQSIMDEAALMASMPYDEYIKMRTDREAENRKYTSRPSEVDQSLWYSMTLDQKKAYYEAGNN